MSSVNKNISLIYVWESVKCAHTNKHKHLLGFMSSLQVRITDWVYRQLCCCTTPIHPVIAPLIEAFVNSVIVPASRSDCTNDPISEDELGTIFSDLCVPNAHGSGSKKVGFTTQLLLVYYVLLYEDTLLNNMSSIGEMFKILLLN